MRAKQFRRRSTRWSATFADATSDRLDGLRLDWTHADGSGSWLLVRASNTEPIVRIIAEAPTADEAQRLCDEAANVIKRCEVNDLIRVTAERYFATDFDFSRRHREGRPGTAPARRRGR